MKKLIILISLIHIFTTANAQWNPFVTEPIIYETPINLAIDSFTNISFIIGNSANEPMNDLSDPLRFTVSFIKVQPGNMANPAASVSGADWFSVQYLTKYNMYYFTQIAPIPHALDGGAQRITINVKVTIPSPSTNKTNGFAVNIQPPGYANGSNNVIDDDNGLFTYTIYDPSVLPVELVRFEGSLNQCNTELLWETASELNNDYFSVQKSTNGTDWDEIAQVKGNGNSTSPKSYRYTDEDLNASLAYYRLVQTDYDGKNEMSKVITVDGQGCSRTGFKLYPNPTHDFINIELDNIKESYKYVIYSALGDIVKASDFSNSVHKIAVGDLPSGSYLINLVSDTKQISKIFIVQK
ncbi:MAG TPA: T9SS type A sorting domain-containing protein [Chitinophagales bacterium]|nr:T9SS type A sorting domain-containing protein [Chitinophagales bacterium]